MSDQSPRSSKIRSDITRQEQSYTAGAVVILFAVFWFWPSNPPAAPTCDVAGAMRAAETEFMETDLWLYAGDYAINHPTGDMNRYARQTKDGKCAWHVYSYVTMQELDNLRNQQRRYLAADVHLDGKKWRVKIRR